MRIAIQGCCQRWVEQNLRKDCRIAKIIWNAVDLLLICGDFQGIRSEKDFSSPSPSHPNTEIGRLSWLLEWQEGCSCFDNCYWWKITKSQRCSARTTTEAGCTQHLPLGTFGLVQVGGLKFAVFLEFILTVIIHLDTLKAFHLVSRSFVLSITPDRLRYWIEAHEKCRYFHVSWMAKKSLPLRGFIWTAAKETVL